MGETPRWLSASEQNAWRTIVGLHQKLNAAMSRDLQASSKLSGADFQILVALTDAPDGRQRFQELAKVVEWEQSRLSHQIARMTKRGLVTRQDCAEDARGAFVVITPAGRQVIEAAAPRHVALVRRLVIDVLTADELATLARLSQRVIDRLEDASE
ncbi:MULTISPECIES: MarR family winged helix-turn-helix transcriptional regulator [Nocardioides]|uniref:MarR family winged helix-turn-helix transcriptional regulator n=1 Tax=Nocardioides vastitatis TaxID=2568655 RepID=A0ABW0ZNK1_9ACTN|nr:MarR family winged helix-turn-helix transcriptional regulator [Nocardioides sp.]THI92525.1 winged helix-turn-helix transcriptional regulator [Nocardioides sp.]